MPPPRVLACALRAALPRVRQVHRAVRADVAELDARAARVVAAGAWTDSSEAQAADVLARCGQICQPGSGLSVAEVRRVCAAADRLGQAVIDREIKAVPAQVFARYVEFYAQLARPDIAQQAFGRLAGRWRRPPMAVCSAQMLALLRLAADGADGGRLLRQTTDDPAAVHARLKHRSAREVVEAELRRERWLRRATKVLEYGSYAALGVLAAKWLAVGTSVVPAGAGPGQRAAALGVAMAVGVGCVRLVLRHSVMGFLTAPTATRPSSSPAGTAPTRLSAASDVEARRILRRAFPAAPSEREMGDIDELLAVGAPQMTWRLRLALAWSRFAHRLAVVEPALLTMHGLRQRLATLWIHSLLRMLPAHARTDATARAVDGAVAELAQFVRDSFALVPLGVSPADIAALAALVAARSSPRSVAALAQVAADGLLAVSRAAATVDADDFLANWRAADEALLAASAVEVGRRRAAAQVLVLTALLDQLLLRAARSDPIPREMLDQALRAAVEAAPHAPLSAPLLQAAFAAAEALGSDDAASQLVQALETRFAAGDPHIQRILCVGPQRGGLRLPGDDEADPPAAACVAPYLHMLARRKPDQVDALVDRWRRLGILADGAPIHFLASAAESLVVGADGAALSAERWAALGCRLAADPAAEPRRTVVPLGRLLARAMDLCHRSGDLQRALAVFAAWRAAAAQRPELHSHATGELNGAAVRMLASLAGDAGSATAHEHLRHCLCVLDHMRNLRQAPEPADFDAVCAAASRLGVDIARHAQYWAPVLERSAQSNQISSFARSLLNVQRRQYRPRPHCKRQ